MTLFQELWDLPWHPRQRRIRSACSDCLREALLPAILASSDSEGFIRLDREIERELVRRGVINPRDRSV